MPTKQRNIVELKHVNVQTGKNAIKPYIVQPSYSVPRLSTEIIGNRWRALSTGFQITLDAENEKFVRTALEAIAAVDFEVDQRDIYYALRGKFGEGATLAGHPLGTIEAYDTFVGSVMEKLQLAVGYTMQSLGIRAGPRGYITGDDRTIFQNVKLPTGNISDVPVSASPTIQFNLVDENVTLKTQARKLIHYEKAAGMNSLLVSDMPTMIEALVMTSQGYNVEAATKMHADMEKRGLGLYVLGDSDPHGMQIQLSYGKASKSNSYMPDVFYPKKAVLLGLFPTIAKTLNLPPEHVTDVHMRVVPNLEKIIHDTDPSMQVEAEVFKTERKQWEWQSLSNLDAYAPAVYLVEALRAKENEIKYVPEANNTKATIEHYIKTTVEEFVDEEIKSFARNWLMENIYPVLVEQLERDLEGDIADFKDMADRELEKLRQMKSDDLREAVKLKLVKNPKQYWTDGIRKVINDMLKQKFDIKATVDWNVDTQGSSQAEKHIEINDPEVPEQPLTKDDIVESIEKRLNDKKGFKPIIQRIRDALETRFGKPSQVW